MKNYFAPVLLFALFGCPVSAQKVDVQSIAAQLDELIPIQMRGENIPGAALVIVIDGEVVHAKGYGLADVAGNVPVDMDRTLWRIGSVSKAVTSMGVLRLIDQGKLRMDDSVLDILPGFVFGGRAFEQPVLVQHLLSHTGGFDQPGSDRNYFEQGQRIGLEAFLRRDLRRIRPPGRVCCYDTYGMSLAGYLAGQVSGLGYAHYMRKQVFEPLGMMQTWVEAPAQARKDLAVGYGFGDAGQVVQRYELYESLPASSIDSTANDMGRLLIALLGDGSNAHGRLFKPETQALLRQPMFRPHPDFPGYRQGFWEIFHAGRRLVWHGGTMNGYSCSLYLAPEQGIGWFSICNRDGETGPRVSLHDEVADHLARALLPAPPAETEEASELQGFATESFAGAYAQNLYSHLGYEGEGWRVGDTFDTVRAIGSGEIELFGRKWRAVEPLLFRDSGGRSVLFYQDDSGQVRGFFMSWTIGSVYERMDDALLYEVLGSEWREGMPAPLVAIVYRANAQLEEAADAYQSIAATRPVGSLSRASANLYSGWSLARLGLVEEAELAFAEAEGDFIAASESSLFPVGRVARILRQMKVLTLLAYVVAGEVDSAITLAEVYIDEGMLASEIRSAVAAEPLLAPLRKDSRFRN